MQPGKIHSRNRAKQIIDFSGLRYNSPSTKGDITPTDIDGFIEYDNKCFIFVEIKLKGNPLPYGQQLALKRLVNDCSKPSILFIAEHNVESPHNDINAAECIVRKYYRAGKWGNWNGKEYTLKQAIDSYLTLEAGYNPPQD